MSEQGKVLLRTGRSDWPDLYGLVVGPEVRLSYQAHRNIAMSPTEARDLADWLLRAAREAEAQNWEGE